MKQDKIYEIVTNKNGRKILVINDIVYISDIEEIKYSDFEAIFVNISDPVYEVNRLAIWKVSPILQDKCWLKPIYVNKLLDGRLRMTHYLLDGYAATPFDAIVSDGIEDIYTRIKDLNINYDLLPILSRTDLWIRMCRYSISRGNFTFTSGKTNGFATGYILLYNALFEGFHETIFMEENMNFLQKLLNMGYIRRKRFIEKIHLCPKCYNDYLIFAECCPKCKSSNIQSESVIHHFRCANISPESTYSFDDQLRCPKCKQFLRHIGVDYDRPSYIYVCNDCSNTFLQSNMKVLCTNCSSVLETSELKPFDNIEYEFTAKGIQAFSTNEVKLNVETDLITGYIDYDHFRHSLYALASNEQQFEHRSILVMCFYLDNKIDTLFNYNTFFYELVQALVPELRYCQFSYQDSIFYVMYMPAKGNEDLFIQTIKEKVENKLENLIKELKNITYKTDYFICNKSENITQFLNKIG